MFFDIRKSLKNLDFTRFSGFWFKAEKGLFSFFL
nr:MAG TPA: hypothetical protein [Caudoviricetes sp.]